MYQALLFSNSEEIRIRTILQFSILFNCLVTTVHANTTDLPTNGSPNCHFNRSLCGYKIIRDAGSSDVTWSLISNSLDRTYLLPKGNYVALIGSGKEGARSSLQSPNFQTTLNERVLFFYYLFGDNPGQLQVAFIQNDTKTVAHKAGWLDIEDHGTILNYGCMQLPQNRTGRIMFTGILGSSIEKIIAIYNVSISHGRCEHNVQKTTCTFDNSLLCNYTTNCLGFSKYVWKRRRGETPSLGTGPHGDAVESYNGFYLYAESSYGNLGDSAFVKFHVSNTKGSYIHFWYHMHGKGIGSLHLRYHHGKSSTDQWCVSGDQGYKWRYFCKFVKSEINSFSLVAFRGASHLGDIAIDNVSVDKNPCEYKSLNCRYTTPFICGYTFTNKWLLVESGKGFKMMTALEAGNYVLKSPTVDLLDSCVRIHYQLHGVGCILNIYENQTTLYVLATNEDWIWTTVQFYIGQARMHLKIEMAGNEGCELSVDEVSVVKGSCPKLDCPRLMHTCKDNFYCVSKNQMCDRQRDCKDGSDEICTSSLACDFEYSHNCGYFGTRIEGIAMFQRIRESRNNSDYSIRLFGYSSNLTSQIQRINDSCVHFTYSGSAHARVQVFVIYTKTMKSALVWKTIFSEKETPWANGQFFVSAGIVQLMFNVQGRYNSQFKLDDIVLKPGVCPPIACEEDEVSCAQNSQCIKKTNICNRQIDCLDKSDEMNCPASIDCDFEQANLCDYQFDEGWISTTGMKFGRPRLDHSTGTYYGHYMAARFLNRSLVSPEITLKNTTCVRFYYYICGDSFFRVYENQILRMQIKSNNIDKWQMAQLQLSAGKITLRFMQITAVFSASLAIDSISAIPGACPKIDCPDKWRRCPTIDICVPYFRICDGEIDCPNGEDENNCTSNSTVRLINGQNINQGQVEYRVNGTWNKVCYKTEANPSSKANARVACRQLGYSGSAKDTFRTFEEENVITNIKNIDCTGNETSLSQCSLTYCKGCYCGYFFRVDCSNHHCLSDQVPCPGLNGTSYNSSSPCIWMHNLCDGEYDCPDGTDEQNCKTCNGNEFRCRNKQCISQMQRCDGVPDCQDSSDEHSCFIQNQTTIMLMQNGKYQALCEVNINNQKIANELCRAVGKHNGTILQSLKTGFGIELATSSKNKSGILSGYYPVRVTYCKLLNLMCNLKGCGTRASWTKYEPTVKYGIFALPGEWPWMAAIFRDGTFLCGGTLISERYVLTAAHCVRTRMSKYLVKLGSLSRMSGGQNIAVRKIIAHPGFESRYYRHDVALMELAYPVNLNDYVQIACLPSGPVIPNAQCYATGWGDDEKNTNPEYLKEVKVNILPTQLCLRYYPFAENVTFCGNNAEPYQPVCFGDSGGPLQCTNKHGHWEVAGVISYGQVNCLGKISSPEGFADIYAHLDWIIENAPDLYK